MRGRGGCVIQRSKIAGVAVDDWQLPIFKKHLDAAGYKYEELLGFIEGTRTRLLRVHYEWVHELQNIIDAAQRECVEATGSCEREAP